MDSQQTIDLLAAKHSLSHASIGALAWLLWDILINLDHEVDHIWRRPRSWVSWLYVILRYAPLCHGFAVFPLGLDKDYDFPHFACRIWQVYQIAFVEILILLVECVLVMRVYILYNQNKIILSIIILGFAVEVIVMVLALALVIPTEHFTQDCLISKAPRVYIAYWLSSLIFETFLFALTLYQFSGVALQELRQKSIVFIFIRDGTWAFALIFVLNTMLYQLENSPLAGMGYFWTICVLSFAGSHVLLNLRRMSSTELDSLSIMSLNLPDIALPKSSDRSCSGNPRYTSSATLGNSNRSPEDIPLELRPCSQSGISPDARDGVNDQHGDSDCDYTTTHMCTQP
ncbi:hypothetical protein BC835DRAFT_420522 [Cytidiella melzeri]|nr:hypothetical protein BC835DRAFT_420522 [Cytidiella melzeri]